MKKLVVVAGVAAVLYAVYRRFRAETGERSLWTEVTDPIE
jgi:hypothetical protein